jgi:hypothetical protein
MNLECHEEVNSHKMSSADLSPALPNRILNSIPNCQQIKIFSVAA